MPNRRRPQPDADRESRRLRIVARVRAIPEGYVRTYGDVDPGARRLVGRVLRVTPLELFFDLVFVFAFTQVTTVLSDDPTWEGSGTVS
jgi:hypothetical protein